MTQGRDGISLAPTGARRLMGLAHRLSVVAVGFAIAALVAGTAATSFAQTALLDTVIVSNYGAAFAGSLTTFEAGSKKHTRPFLLVKGTNTLLGASTGPAGLSVSSLDGHVAVNVPIDLVDLTGFGAAAGLSNGPGTGFAEIFSPGADKNSVPENIIGTRNVSFDNTGCLAPGSPLVCCTGVNTGTCQFNTSGVNTDQGLAFEDPFDGVNPGKDILAIANTLPVNFFSTSDLLDGTNGGAACNAFGSGTCTGPGTPMACCTGVGTGTCAGMVVGTITEFDRATLAPGFNDAVAPFNNHPVCTLPAVAIPPNTEPPTTCPTGSVNNATIGGCLTFLLGPVALAYDETGFLFAVNEAGVASGGPGFVTVYAPGAAGDVFPTAIVGLAGTTAGAFVDPAKIAVASDTDFFDDVIFVTDVGDNSIKIFSPFTNFSATDFFYTGTELGVISGGHTKLRRPEGIALGEASGALYVVNNSSSSLEMFTDFTSLEDGGDIAPTLIIQGRNTKLNFPVDVALPEFTPSASPTETIVGAQR
ncbi:hypothetical protein [Candidatus Binatus sp.]|uniref:hypothetical protein n=1 Tax=Candidatus Binatus sp. TaxID=2811406 RepID=UPI003BB1E70E